jgi:hypothetical protein
VTALSAGDGRLKKETSDRFWKLVICQGHKQQEQRVSAPLLDVETQEKTSHQRNNPKLSLSGSVCVSADGSWEIVTVYV